MRVSIASTGIGGVAIAVLRGGRCASRNLLQSRSKLGENVVRRIVAREVAADIARVGADSVELTPEQLARLDQLTPAAGGHHAEAQMGWIDR